MFVLCITEAENHEEDRGQEDEANAEASGFTEGLGELNVHDDAKHKVGERKEREEAEHWLHVQDLEKGVGAVNWDKSFPAVLAGLLENLPFSDNDKNVASNSDENQEDAEDARKDSCACGGRHGR